MQPREISARSNLAELAGRLTTINERLGNCCRWLESMPEAAAPPTQTGTPGNGDIHTIIDFMRREINLIDDRVEFLSARL